MAWIIGAVVLYILLSAFIVIALCVHSSRLSQAEQGQQWWEPQQPARHRAEAKALVEVYRA